jgi:hypothetical protein
MSVLQTTWILKFPDTRFVSRVCWSNYLKRKGELSILHLVLNEINITVTEMYRISKNEI